MLTGRRYRLELDAAQVALCERFADVCRAVWNIGLEQRREYRRRGAWVNYEQQCAELAEAKRDFSWLTEAPSCVLQQALRDLDRACRRHGSFKIHWRSKTRWAPSFRFPDPRHFAVERIGRKWGRVKLAKLGWVRFRWSRSLGGQVRSATISKSGTDWFISFLVDDGVVTPERHVMPKTATGVDRGVKIAATTSDGVFYDRSFASQGEAQRLRRLQQKLARQETGSIRRNRTREAIKLIAGRAHDRRTDFCAQTASTLAAGNAVIALEDLRIRNMTASARGTVETPGRNVRQKAGLNRAIRDKGWHKLELAIRSAARYTGTKVVLVNPAYTSQTCNVCKHVDSKSRESQAVFRCTACMHQDHADVNAAKNILAAGLAVTGRGDLAVGQSAKRQPPAMLTVTGIPAQRGGEEANASPVL